MMSKGMPPAWYSAWLVFESSIDQPDYVTPLREDRIVLFQARTLEEAQHSAGRYGRNEEQSYKNEAGETVHWRLVEIEDVQKVDDEPTPDGWEVASRHMRVEASE